MGVGVMLIVNVWMGMHHRLVRVRMLMTLAQMQPHPRRHQKSRNRELCRQGVTERNYRDSSAKERCS